MPNVVAKHSQSKKFDIPDSFRLGSGHVKFFYDKLLYLKNRYEEIYSECLQRGFNVTYYGSAWDGIPNHLMNDWTPTNESIRLIEQRIKERLDASETAKRTGRNTKESAENS